MIRTLQKQLVYLSSKHLLAINKSNFSIVRQKRLSTVQSDLKPRLIVEPRTSLLDAKTTFRVEGLEPFRPATLKAEMTDDGGKLLTSNGHYVASREGVVDTSFSESVGGSYKGVFPSALLSLLKIAKGNYEYGAVRKLNIAEPNRITILLQDGHIPAEEETFALDSVNLERHFLSPGVKRIPVREGRVRGVLYIPEGGGPFPGLIDMMGATGFLNETRSALNASRGFASLALAYFNYDDIPEEKILDLDLDYVEEAVSYLLSHPSVKSEQCGILAGCAGGFLGLLTALYIDRVKAVFLINMPVRYFAEKIRYRNEIIATGPVLTQSDVLELSKDGSYKITLAYVEQISQIDQNIIEKMLKTKDVQFAVALGDEDSFKFHCGWSKAEKVLADKGFSRLKLKVYPRAGHIIHAPYTPFVSSVHGKMWVFPEAINSEGILLYFGGQSFESVQMQEDTWKWMFDFFSIHLK